MADKRKLIVITHCRECPMVISGRDDDWCAFDEDGRNIPRHGVPDWCPLGDTPLELRVQR